LLVVPYADPPNLSSCPTFYQFIEQFGLVEQHCFLGEFEFFKQLRWRLAFVGKLQFLELRFLQQFGRQLALFRQFRLFWRRRSLRLILWFESCSRQFQRAFERPVRISRLITP
jgi:hypothetical protein